MGHFTNRCPYCLKPCSGKACATCANAPKQALADFLRIANRTQDEADKAFCMECAGELLRQGVRVPDHVLIEDDDVRAVYPIRDALDGVKKRSRRRRSPGIEDRPRVTVWPKKNQLTGYYGVRQIVFKHSVKFSANIRASNNTWYAMFPTAEEAARQYDAWSWAIYQDRSRLNFPEGIG